MKRSQFLSVTVLALVSFALASCGSPWQVVRQAPGNPFGGSPIVQVIVDYQGLMIDTRRPIPEAEWLARKTPEQQAAWQSDKAILAQHLVTEMAQHANGGFTISPEATTPGPNHFIVAVRITAIEPGSPARLAEVNMIARLGTPEGQVLDEVNFGFALQQGSFGAFSGLTRKMEKLGDNLGKLLARYVRERTGH